MKASNLKIGQILINSGAITEEQLEEILKKQKTSKKRIADILVEDGIVTEQQVCKALEKQLLIPYLDLDTVQMDPEQMANLIPENLAQQYMVLPIALEGRFLTIAVADPLNYKAFNDIAIYTKLKIKPVIAEPTKINNKFRELYASQKAYDDAKEFVASQQMSDKTKEEAEEAAKAEASGNDQPIIRFVNNMMEEAVYQKASDIHIEPMEKCMRIRFRIDGNCQIYMETAPELIPSVTSRIKFIGNMNIAEKRIPQDGRINYKVGGMEIDLRISVLPSMFGEKIVMRITTSLGMELKKENIGFLPENLKKFEHLVASHRGIILVTGATGSGKSTTLYTGLRSIMRDEINIITVENPVEMIVPGITQVNINEKAGLTFAAALRSILRQDPDVIMIGEIRDGETANIAVSAAITGHLVLSTLHTYDAPSSVARLVDMGIEPYMVSSALLGIIAQKLVLRLCKECKQPYSPSQEERMSLNLPLDDENITLYKPCGCEKCNKKGYKGRIAVHEIMLFTHVIKRAVTKNISSDELRDVAIEDGMIPMTENVRRLVLQGITSYEVFIDVTISND